MTPVLQPPVTNAQWRAFCDETGHPDYAAPGRPNQPVRNINAFDADAYAAWAGGRLPTEEELIQAEKGLENADWSAWPMRNLPNVGDSRVPVSATGDTDVRGVLYWWTSTAHDSFRVARGGSWFIPAGCVRVAFCYRFDPDDCDDFIGFRLVAEEKASV